MATSYRTDRTFTEYVHHHVARPQVYQSLGWSPFRLSKREAEQLDCEHGIDRIFYTSEGYLVSVQERFRAGEYAARYNDVTLRYRRDHNRHAERRWSEFFKIQADYLLYGVVDGEKSNFASIRSFQKVVLLKVPPLFEKLMNGNIVIREDQTGKSFWDKEKMIVPVNHNRDGSSSFVAFDVALIHRAWPREIVVWQRGFIPPQCW